MANGSFYGYNPAEWRKNYGSINEIIKNAGSLISMIPEIAQERKMSREREDYADLAKQGTDALLQGLMDPDNEEIKNDIKASYGVETDEELADIWNKTFSSIRAGEDRDSYSNRIAAGMANMASYLNASGKDPSVLAYVLKALPDGSVMPQNALKVYSDSVNRATNKSIYKSITDLGDQATEEQIQGAYAEFGRQPDDFGKEQIGQAKIRKTQGLVKQASDDVIKMMVSDPNLLSLDGQSLSTLQARLDENYPPEIVKRIVDTGYKDLQLKAQAERLKAGDDKAIIDSIRRTNETKDKALVSAERIKATMTDDLRINEVELAKAQENDDKEKMETLKSEQARLKRGLKKADAMIDKLVISDYGTLAGAAGAAEIELRGEEQRQRGEFVEGITETDKEGVKTIGEKRGIVSSILAAFTRGDQPDINIGKVSKKAEEAGYNVRESVKDMIYEIVDPGTGTVIATFDGNTGEVTMPEAPTVGFTGGGTADRTIPTTQTDNPLEQFFN